DLSSLASVVPTVYATHCPSREICGSLTLRKRVRSSSFIGRRVVCAANELASASMSSREIQDRRRRSIWASRDVVLRTYSAEEAVYQRSHKGHKEAHKSTNRLSVLCFLWASLCLLWLRFQLLAVVRRNDELLTDLDLVRIPQRIAIRVEDPH